MHSLYQTPVDSAPLEVGTNDLDIGDAMLRHCNFITGLDSSPYYANELRTSHQVNMTCYLHDKLTIVCLEPRGMRVTKGSRTKDGAANARLVPPLYTGSVKLSNTLHAPGSLRSLRPNQIETTQSLNHGIDGQPELSMHEKERAYVTL